MPHSRSLKHSFINCCFRWCIWGSLSTWIAKPKRKDRHLIDLIFWLMSSWHLWNIHRMWSSVYNRPGTSWHLAFMTKVFCVAMPACPIPFKTIWNKKHRQIQKEVLQKSTWCFVKPRVIPGFVWFEQAKQLPLMCNMFSTWFQPQWFNPYLCLPGVLLQKCLRCCNVRCAKVNRVFAVDASDSGNSWFDVGPWQQNKQTSHWQKFQMLQDAACFFFQIKGQRLFHSCFQTTSVWWHDLWLFLCFAKKSCAAKRTWIAAFCWLLTMCVDWRLMLRSMIHPSQPRFGPPLEPLTVAALGRHRQFDIKMIKCKCICIVECYKEMFVSNCLLFNLHNVCMHLYLYIHNYVYICMYM